MYGFAGELIMREHKGGGKVGDTRPNTMKCTLCTVHDIIRDTNN